MTLAERPANDAASLAARDRQNEIIALGVAAALVGGGYLWKGWKGAVGVPAGASAAFLVAVLLGNR